MGHIAMKRSFVPGGCRRRAAPALGGSSRLPRGPKELDVQMARALGWHSELEDVLLKPRSGFLGGFWDTV